jgi:hypothetical protein
MVDTPVKTETDDLINKRNTHCLWRRSMSFVEIYPLDIKKKISEIAEI